MAEKHRNPSGGGQNSAPDPIDPELEAVTRDNPALQRVVDTLFPPTWPTEDQDGAR